MTDFTGITAMSKDDANSSKAQAMGLCHTVCDVHSENRPIGGGVIDKLKYDMFNTLNECLHQINSHHLL